jgi:phosphonate transport system substrate-binding protein
VSLSRRTFLGALSALVLSGCRESVATKEAEVDPLSGLAQHPPLTSLRVGITPIMGARTAAAIAPLVRFLERELSVPVDATIATHYDALAELVTAGSIDLGIFSPGAYVKARDAMPAVPLATATRSGSPTYLGYLVVRQDSRAVDLASLRGQSIAWVDPTSSSGYVYPRALLRSRGYDPDAFFARSIMTGDHDRSLEALLAGEVDVAAVTNSLIQHPSPQLAPRVGELRVVAKTRRIPLDCLVLHRSVDRAFAARVRDALLGLVRDRGASEELAADWNIRGFVPFARARYDDVADVLRAGA